MTLMPNINVKMLMACSISVSPRSAKPNGARRDVEIFTRKPEPKAMGINTPNMANTDNNIIITARRLSCGLLISTAEIKVFVNVKYLFMSSHLQKDFFQIHTRMHCSQFFQSSIKQGFAMIDNNYLVT